MKRILIIDDEEDIAEILATFLEMDFNCEYVCSGKEGLDKLFTESYDAVITDLEMPDLSGTRIIEAIRAKSLPVTILICSGHDRSHPKVMTALGAGAKDVLTKPFTDPDELIKTIHNALA